MTARSTGSLGRFHGPAHEIFQSRSLSDTTPFDIKTQREIYLIKVNNRNTRTMCEVHSCS